MCRHDPTKLLSTQDQPKTSMMIDCCDQQQQQQQSITAETGDVCTIELDLQANHGFVPEPLFDTSGRISFVLDHGNYLPAIHELVRGTMVQQEVMENEIDAGYGAYRTDLVIEKVPLQKLQGFLAKGGKVQEGDTLYLGGQDVPVLVAHVNSSTETATLDMNVPLAGSSYQCRFQVVDIEPSPWSVNSSTNKSHFHIATLALGCFWGAELFAMRIPGVVGTRVGHVGRRTEAVQIMFDTRVLSYAQLLERAVARLKEIRESVIGGDWLWNQEQEEEESAMDEQYRHGIYCHDADQFRVAQQVVQQSPSSGVTRIAVAQAPTFRVAESDQQQYLLKGGQSARKNDKTAIRCFG